MTFSPLLRLLGLCLLAMSSARAAVPAHYVVFERDVQGRAEPVFYAQVRLADDGHDRAGAVAAERGVERIGYRALRNGTKSAVAYEARQPNFLRAEFARDPQRGDGAIQSHPLVRDPHRAFVVRLPLAEADAIELGDGAGKAVQRFDLRELALRSAQLPLATTAAPAAAPTAVAAATADKAANSANRLDILVLGDGYTAAEQGVFADHAAALKTAMFQVSPYKEYQSFVNWQAGFVASSQSGADHPPYQAGCTGTSCCADSGARSDPLAGRFVATALDATFCTSQIHRLLTVRSSKVMAAAAGFPDWDKIIVTVNDPVYGGAGGSYAVLSAHASAALIAIHEFGHSFHGLADEYETPYPGFPACSDVGGNAPCEANVTNQSNASLVKWRSWFTPGLPIPTPDGTAGTGLFEGARYRAAGMYRPVGASCLMRALGTSFCPVCRQEYVRKLYRGGFGSPAAGIDLIEPGSESPSPATAVNYQRGSTRRFSAALLQPSVGALGVQWYLDGVAIPGATSPSYDFVQSAATPATRTLELRVTDRTAFVQPAMAGDLLLHQRRWTIRVGAALRSVAAAR
ncbi:M64 family metallopeptidase [Lysobacter sp. BMK333-48F3]|uniref:M64 family metallopeptidase n=1 Tax=Lysobacter sp. BMK333-48F3 TaxID=2867962 RepID=UPI001C8C4201|nr:M64 family metallopeptidase [Lysobacter sp. BMK333-48F3]MBX9401141.1 M64 family metallopeptidase [Lysobacter sp. BMK333-48F3]